MGSEASEETWAGASHSLAYTGLGSSVLPSMLHREDSGRRQVKAVRDCSLSTCPSASFPETTKPILPRVVASVGMTLGLCVMCNRVP